MTRRATPADKYQYTSSAIKVIEQDLYSESLSHLKLPRVCLPRYEDWGDVLRWLLTENVPGAFPYARPACSRSSGRARIRPACSPAKVVRSGPTERFHYLSASMPAKRLSTAFDSVTLYGEDPDHRPDIYGKIGNSGVSHRQRRRRQEALLRFRPGRTPRRRCR